METHNTEQSAPVKKLPRCPYCTCELETMNNAIGVFKGLIAMQVWCSNDECRKLLSIQFLGPAAAPEQKRVINPGDFARMVPPNAPRIQL
jgi:hypothetical protein